MNLTPPPHVHSPIFHGIKAGQNALVTALAENGIAIEVVPDEFRGPILTTVNGTAIAVALALLIESRQWTPDQWGEAQNWIARTEGK